MQVILRQDVEKVGLRGEVVDVAAGFARNYLLPRRLAEPAAPGRVAELEKLAAGRAQHEAQSFEQAQELVFISINGMVQRTAARGINRYGRASQGVRVMNVREDDRVSAVALVMESEAETAAGVAVGSEDGAGPDLGTPVAEELETEETEET